MKVILKLIMFFVVLVLLVYVVLVLRLHITGNVVTNDPVAINTRVGEFYDEHRTALLQLTEDAMKVKGDYPDQAIIITSRSKMRQVQLSVEKQAKDGSMYFTISKHKHQLPQNLNYDMGHVGIYSIFCKEGHIDMELHDTPSIDCKVYLVYCEDTTV